MKKIIFTLAVLLTATVSASAQGYVMKVMNGEEQVASLMVDDVTDVVFEEYFEFWNDGVTSALQNLAYGQTVDLSQYVNSHYTDVEWTLSGDTGIENSTDSAVEISADGVLTVNFFTDEASNGYHEMINRTVTVIATDSEGEEHTATATIAGGHFIHNFADGIGNIQIIGESDAWDPVYSWNEGDKYVTIYLSNSGAQNLTIAHSGNTDGSTTGTGGFMVDPTNYPYICMRTDIPVSLVSQQYFYGGMYGYLSTEGEKFTSKFDTTTYYTNNNGTSFGENVNQFTIYGNGGPYEVTNGILCINLSSLGLSSYIEDGLVSLDVLEFQFEGYQNLNASTYSPTGALTGADEGGNYKAYWVGSFKSVSDAEDYYRSAQ